MERLQQSDCKTCLFINTSKTHRVLHPVRFIFLRLVLFFLYQKFLVCHRICSVVLTFLGGGVYSQWLLQGHLFEKLDVSLLCCILCISYKLKQKSTCLRTLHDIRRHNSTYKNYSDSGILCKNENGWSI